MADRRKILVVVLLRSTVNSLIVALLLLSAPLHPSAIASSPSAGAATVQIRIRSGGAEVAPASIVDPAVPLAVDLSAGPATAVPMRSVTLRASLRSLTTERIVWSKERVVDLSAGRDAATLRLEDIELPSRDDAYRLTAWIRESRSLLSFSEPASYAEASHYFYAISRRPQLRGDPKWEPHASLLPLEKPWWNPQALVDHLPLGNNLPLSGPLDLGERLDVTRQLKLRRDLDVWLGSGDTSVGSGACEPSTWQGATVYRLEPGAWHVWPLPACDSARPHRVVVGVPKDRAAHFSVGIFDSHSTPSEVENAGATLAVHGSALVHEGAVKKPAGEGDDGEVVEHRLSFWPRGQQRLMIRNLDPQNHVLIRSIAVEADTSVAAAPEAEPRQESAEQAGGRPVVFYADAEMLRSLGHLASSTTSDDSAERDLAIARYLTWHTQRSGFNAAIVQLDAGDPLARCLLHLFDREGLRLIPALDLDATARRASETDSTTHPAQSPASPTPVAAALTGDEGSDAEQSTEGPHILDPIVQRRLTGFVASQLAWFREHSSFGGLAIRLTDPSPLSFAALDSGANASVMEAFSRDVGKTFATPVEARAWIASEGRSTWIEWRAQRTTQFLQQLAVLARPRQLLLLIEHSAATQARGELSQNLLSRGISLTQLSAQAGITPLLRHRWRPTASFSARQTDFAAAMQNRHTVSTDTSLGSWIDLGGRFELLSIRTSPESSAERLVRVPVAERSTKKDRLPIARLLAGSDIPVIVVGGSQFPWGIERTNQSTLGTLAQLPAGCSDIGPGDGGPRLRATSSREGRFLYATNDNLWPQVINIEFDETAPTTPVLVGSTSSVQQTILTNRWHAELPPGSLTAIRIPPAARVRRLSVRPANIEQTAAEIRSQLQDLGQRVAVFSSLMTGELITGGSFEQQENGKPVGWLAAQHPSDAVSTDDRRASEGERSVRLENNVPVSTQTWLLSKPLVPTESGRMMISLTACTDGPPEQLPTVRLSIEARYADRPTRTSVVLGDPDTGPALSADWSTQRFSVGTTALPREGLQELRVAIDVQGAGRVWIDDIRRHDFFLPPTERADLQRQIFLASEGLGVGELEPASLLFSNPLVVQLQQLPMPQPVPPRPPVESSQPRPTIADRLRGLLPQALQFR